MKKEITFFYLDNVEKWALENIFDEASKHGYKVKYSKNRIKIIRIMNERKLKMRIGSNSYK